MQIGHKSLGFQELTYDVFGPRYAKRTQFRVVEGGTLEGSLCRKPARRRARSTRDRVIQIGVESGRQACELCQKEARFNYGRSRVATESKLRRLARFGCSMVSRLISAFRRPSAG